MAIMSSQVRVETRVYCALFKINVDLAIDINLSMTPSSPKCTLVAQSLSKT